jgi:hypothetical protein
LNANAADPSEPERPRKERELPAGTGAIVDGDEVRCYSLDEYKENYLLSWADWADYRAGAYQLEIQNLERQVSTWERMSTTSELAFRTAIEQYEQERRLRLKTNRQSAVVPWLLGAGLALETVTIVALSIWGATQ